MKVPFAVQGNSSLECLNNSQVPAEIGNSKKALKLVLEPSRHVNFDIYPSEVLDVCTKREVAASQGH